MLLNAVFYPVVLMLVVAVLLIVQIGRLLHDSGLVEHSDLVLAQANEVQKLTIDMETGLRGFLVTGDDSFLEPYEHARAALSDASAELYYRTRGRDDQQARTKAIDPVRQAWLDYAAGQIARRRAGGDYAAVVREGPGRRLMDEMRGRFHELIQIEMDLRDQRARHARSASIMTFVLVGLIAVVGGGILAALGWHQFGRITETYDAAFNEARDANQRLEQRVVERTAELNEVNGRLGEMNKELEAFAYSISHDLRAPLRHISGFANLLQAAVGPTLTADDAENLTTIHDTAKHAGRMVDDLLGLSRVGRVTLSVTAVDVAELVEATRRELAPDTAGREISWTIRPIPPVQGDPSLLKMVVSNLLANAVKYTARRTVAAIDVGPADWPDEAGPVKYVGDSVVFAVSDNGVGFDMAYAGKLFGVFQRLHRAEDFAGTGIGLANVKRIVQRLGGSVWAHGVPDGGAKFYVCLPAATAPVPA
jgi:signal transduction histidine kinase